MEEITIIKFDRAKFLIQKIVDKSGNLVHYRMSSFFIIQNYEYFESMQHCIDYIEDWVAYNNTEDN